MKEKRERVLNKSGNRFKDRQGQCTLDGNGLAGLRSGKGPWEVETGVEGGKVAVWNITEASKGSSDNSGSNMKGSRRERPAKRP